MIMPLWASLDIEYQPALQKSANYRSIASLCDRFNGLPLRAKLNKLYKGGHEKSVIYRHKAASY